MSSLSQVDWVIQRLERGLFSQKVAVFEPSSTWYGRIVRWIRELVWNLYDWMVPGSKARAVYDTIRKQSEQLYCHKNLLDAATSPPTDWFESIASRVCLANLHHKPTQNWEVLAAQSDRASVAWARWNSTSPAMNELLRTLCYSPVGDWIADAYGVSDMAILSLLMGQSLSSGLQGSLDTFKGRSSFWKAIFDKPMPKLDEKPFEALFVQHFSESIEVLNKLRQPLPLVDPLWMTTALFKKIHGKLTSNSCSESHSPSKCNSYIAMSDHDPCYDMIEEIWIEQSHTSSTQPIELFDKLPHTLRPLALAISLTFPKESEDIESLLTVTLLASTNVDWTRQPELIQQALLAFKGYSLHSCSSAEIKKLWVYACGGQEPAVPSLAALPHRLSEVWKVNQLLGGNHQKWAHCPRWFDLIEMPYLLQKVHESSKETDLTPHSPVNYSSDSMLVEWYQLINAYCLSAGELNLNRMAFYQFATGHTPTFSLHSMQGVSWIKQVLADAKESLGILLNMNDYHKPGNTFDIWCQWLDLGVDPKKARELTLNSHESIALGVGDFLSLEIPPVLTQVPYGLDLSLLNGSKESSFGFNQESTLLAGSTTPESIIEMTQKLASSQEQLATLCSYMAEMGSWPLRRLCFLASFMKGVKSMEKGDLSTDKGPCEIDKYHFELYSLPETTSLRLRIEMPKLLLDWRGFVEYEVDEQGQVALIDLKLQSAAKSNTAYK